VSEKEPMMVEWWTKGHNLLINAGVNSHSYKDAVQEANIGFRDGVDEIFKLSREKSIHVLIFSAGLKTIIEEVMKEKLPGAAEVSRIVANEMVHDSDGKLVAFGENLLHTYNKRFKTVCAQSHSLSEIPRQRKSVILMGDSLSDVLMSDGYDCDNILTVGFLNQNIEANLKRYMDTFDVVITGDGSMQFVVDILRQLPTITPAITPIITPIITPSMSCNNMETRDAAVQG